jgi:uncharacterized membrane protein YphA (DoxX/SURF4 family)
MLNPFPGLLDLAFFAPTILRVVVGLVFLYSAYALYLRRAELAHIHFPIVGSGPLLIWGAVVVHTIIGAMLILGYYTQIAALLAVLGGIKGIVFAKKYPRFFILCRLEYGFIIAICLSLLISGAGAFAYDLPL